MSPVPLSRNDAREAARACRALALQQRQQADHMPLCSAQEALRRTAARLEKLALLFEQHASAGPPPAHRPPAPTGARLKLV